jgi:hypothetical protein
MSNVYSNPRLPFSCTDIIMYSAHSRLTDVTSALGTLSVRVHWETHVSELMRTKWVGCNHIIHSVYSVRNSVSISIL